jgi:hypothetical protein
VRGCGRILVLSISSTSSEEDCQGFLVKASKKGWFQMAQDEAEAREFDKILRTPSLVASTSDTYCRSIAESKIRENKLKDVESQEQEYTFIKGMKDEELESNYFKSAQWYGLILMSLNPSN